MFGTHKLNDAGFNEMKKYKATMAESTRQVLELMVDSNEKTVFMQKMDEAIFFGAKAIAQKPENYTEIIEY